MGTTTRAKATTATKAKKPAAAPVRQPRQRRASQPVPKPAPVVPSLLLSVEQAAVALGISRRPLYPILMRGEIRSVLIGRRRLVPVAEIEAYIARLLESA